jgi:hypothetical protein
MSTGWSIRTTAAARPATPKTLCSRARSRSGSTRSTGRWITELLGHYDVVWATGWNDAANDRLAPLLGLAPLPVLAMPAGPFRPADKLPRIAAFAHGRPAAWLDDQHVPEARACAAHRPWPTLLIPVDPARGLLREQVDALLDWAPARRGTIPL